MAKKDDWETIKGEPTGKVFKIVDGDMSYGYHTFDELYEHRIMLFLNLACYGGFPSKFKKEHYPGWDAVYLELPTGQISYHIPIKYRYLYEFQAEECKKDDCYDGHSPKDVLFRLERSSFYVNDNQEKEGK